jgi:alkylhydroperoxidase family enzyme
VDAVLRDFASSALPDPEKTLLVFVQKLTLHPHDVGRQDVETLKTAGWSDEAIYDAITVCSLFNFYNRWCDGGGVHALREEGFAESGRRLARFGYASG